MAFYSPLRYPGGKGKMYKETKKILKDNNLIGCTYVEGFAGGGNLALQLLFKGDVSRVILNDIDPAIYSFWFSILNNGPEFIELIEKTPVTLEERERQKSIFNDQGSDPLSKGFATFYLNRTNRSGILFAGPIGGRDQSGKYLLDCRFNKSNLIERVKKIYENRQRISIYNRDARDFLSMGFPDNTFFFIDPPYYVKGGALYQNSFNHNDHLEIMGIVSNLDFPWVVTYDNVDPIIEMYGNCRKLEYDLTYSLERKYKGKEVMFFANDLIVDF